MKSAWRLAVVSLTAAFICTTGSRADTPVGPAPKTLEEYTTRTAQIGPGKQPKNDSKDKKKGKSEKAEIRKVDVVSTGYEPYGTASGYWHGPVLPGMWGGVYGGLFPNSWWMGGPYLYAGWSGSWGQGWSQGTLGLHCLAGGAWPTILPPVFGPVAYPSVSPYRVPGIAPYWIAPAAAFPPVIVKNDNTSGHQYVPVPAGASADKLYAEALWLFWADNFESARDHLAAAAKQAPRDARLWYYKALAERALGDTKAARRSAETGAALEILAVTDRHTILTALERIQGPDRQFLSDYVSGPNALAINTVRDIVGNLKPADATTLTTAAK